MKTIITGSTSIKDYNLVVAALERINWELSEIVSGGSQGVDSLAERYAQEHQIPIKTFLADRETYGKAAIPIRNAQMAKYADVLVAIWDGNSPGTSNMLTEAKELGLRVVVFLEHELKNKKGSNPIKSNKVFGNYADKASMGERPNIETKDIEFNGKHLTIFLDPKKNPPIINLVSELVDEVKRLKDKNG